MYDVLKFQNTSAPRKKVGNNVYRCLQQGELFYDKFGVPEHFWGRRVVPLWRCALQ